jgi:type II secretory pathway component PulF
MPQFRYKGRNTEGAQSEGVREAADKFSLYRDLRAEGIAATVVEPVEDKGLSFIRDRKSVV